jgi:hypothetical protein
VNELIFEFVLPLDVVDIVEVCHSLLYPPRKQHSIITGRWSQDFHNYYDCKLTMSNIMWVKRGNDLLDDLRLALGGGAFCCII